MRQFAQPPEPEPAGDEWDFAMGLLEVAPPPKAAVLRPERTSAPANTGGRASRGAGRQTKASP
eukprot:12906700-Alexandrium_andersonii.AAC.1